MDAAGGDGDPLPVRVAEFAPPLPICRCDREHLSLDRQAYQGVAGVEPGARRLAPMLSRPLGEQVAEFEADGCDHVGRAACGEVMQQHGTVF